MIDQILTHDDLVLCRPMVELLFDFVFGSELWPLVDFSNRFDNFITAFTGSI